MIDFRVARDAWAFLRPLPLFWRLHQVARSLAFPLRRMLDQLPQARADRNLTLVDLGCGHGVFLALAKKRRPDLDLIGLDLSEQKIAGARLAFSYASIPVLQLEARDVGELSKQSVDVITIIDVMYLVPFERWESVLRKCYDCLKPGGLMLLKEMDPAKRWKFVLLNFEETLAVKVLRLTLGHEFTFPDRRSITELMERVGFSVQEIPVDRGYMVPHFLWAGAKGHSDEDVMTGSP